MLGVFCSAKQYKTFGRLRRNIRQENLFAKRITDRLHLIESLITKQ